jgi:monoamine oxidase
MTGVGIILASYTWGRDAQRHVGMTDSDIIDECLRSLATIHHKTITEIKTLFMEGIVKKWDLDEFALGAFAMFAPYQVTILFIGP